MKKRSFIVLVTVILFICGRLCVVSAAEKLVADLETGTLGSLRIGQAFISDERLDAAIGAKADSVDDSAWEYYFGEEFVDEFYMYNSQGLSITITHTIGAKTETVEITGFKIWVRDSGDLTEVSYKAFKGTLSPGIPINAGQDTIIGIFGEPGFRESHENLSRLAYRMPYGELSFLFEDDALSGLVMYNPES